MPNNFLSIREAFQYARNWQSNSDSLREVLGIDRGDLHLQAKHFPFSVLIYNMALLPPVVTNYRGWNRDGAISELINRIAADPPDVVGLCEVFVDDERDKIRNSLSHIYQYYSEGPDEADLEQDGGLLVLSKHAIVAYYQSIYRECAGRFADCLSNKGVIYIRVSPSNSPTPCDLFLSHTQNIKEDGGKNALYAQLAHLGHMARAFSDPHTPAFIMGDLNIPAEEQTHYNQLITRLGAPVDLWLTKHPPGSGATNTKDNNFYFPLYANEAPSQDERLDYIFMKAGLRFVPILKHIELVKWAHNGFQISDHFGLRARFEQLLEVGIGISGVISKVAATITGFHCIETTSGPGSDEVSFTIKICDQYGRCAKRGTPIIEGVDTYEYHVVNITPVELQWDPGTYVTIEVQGREHDDWTSGSESLGERSIYISRMDLLLNKGRSFNRVMPFLNRDGEYGVDIRISVA